ncbi:MAG: VCBS repeat-containing protein [Sedimentisphaerales bacterium]|nr:VCBS repeat-containing protein [Sedimentisphaerales bacterium]
MGKCIKLSIVVYLILTLNSSAQTITPEVLLADAQENSETATYILNPVYTSWPTYNDTGDLIGTNLQAHFAFDLSSIPDNATVISASFSAYLCNLSETASQRKLWYNSDDNWNDGEEYGESVTADEIVGTLWHDESTDSGYVWKTFVITYDGWANEIASGDDRISLMLTGGQYGAVGLTPGTTGYNWGVLSAPELTLTVAADPNEAKVYSNIFDLGPEEIVKADNLDINIGTYSVPSLADWNNDGLKDLIVGTGSGKVRIYLNIGTNIEPKFSDLNNKSFYAQANGSDLYCTPSGCLGCFPRVVDWDEDGMKDLIVGQSDGSIKFFRNINTDNSPSFDAGTLLTYVSGGYTTYIDVGSRAAPTIVDWNSDGYKDLVSGALDGKIHIFINAGTNSVPLFVAETFALEDKSDLIVPNTRSCPVVLDLDFDGKKDLLTGNTDGKLLLYINTGTDEEPNFSGYELVDANGIEIDLAGTPRSRPFVCYWDEDGYPDVLIGAQDGKVHLYKCKTLQADFDKDGDIDFADWAIFTNYWKQDKYDDKKAADLNNDGKVDIDDVSWILANWLLDIK